MQNYLIVVVMLMFALYLWRESAAVSRQIAKRLKASVIPTGERRYRELFEHSADAIFVVEVLPAGRFRFESINPVALEAIDPHRDGLEGYCFDELANRTRNEARNRVLQDLSLHLAQVVETGMPAQHEGTFCAALDADAKVYDFHLMPMADDNGISHVLCFARDVTAQKLYEQELLKRAKLEERLSGFIACAPGFFYSYRHGQDGSNSMPFASEGINELFGLQPDDVAQSIAPLNMLTHTDDMSRVIEEIARSAAGLSPLTTEFRTRHPAKGELWIELRAMPVAMPDGSIVWHGFMHDVTARKRMEESLRRSRENLAEAQRIGQMGSWELDLASGALTWSDEICRLFEIDPGMLGASSETFLNKIHPDDREAAEHAYTQSMEEQMPFRLDHRLLFPDGRLKYVRACCETRYAEDGVPLQIHGTVQDITALKVTEQQLKDTQHKLRELVINRELLREDERKRIAWEMHEELGQLLAAVKMHMSGMRTQLQNQAPMLVNDSRAMINLIDQSIKTVHEIVSDLRPTVLLHGPVAALEWLVAEFNKHPGMQCDLKVGEQTDALLSDELTTLVFRIVQESLEDAARHTGVSRVQLFWGSSDGKHCLRVQHDGIRDATGMAGTQSLSLFAMQERVLALGGEMQVYSTLEHGSLIEACFP